MDKKIIKNFCKDNMGFSLSFFSNAIIIALFYFISTKSSVEVLYPALLSLFIYLLSMTFRWLRYYPFHQSLMKSKKDAYYELSPSTAEQLEVSHYIAQLHQSYLEKIHTLTLKNREHQHFISQWIHHMKTPVSVIDLILQKYSLEEMEAFDAMKDIKLENERIFMSLEQVLSLLRLEDFANDYTLETIDLAASVKKVINSKKSQFIYSRVFPKFDVPDSPILVLSDAKWNEVLLDQLVSNAIKYSQSPDTPKNIYFQIEKVEDKVVLSIRDEGMGIPSYDLERVFQPFFTGENGRKHKNATGMGLYIAKSIADKLCHKVRIESKAGSGTKVFVSYLSKV